MKKQRNLSGIYFREKIAGEWQDVCFEDLPVKTQKKILKKKDRQFIESMVLMLASSLSHLGEALDIGKP